MPFFKYVSFFLGLISANGMAQADFAKKYVVEGTTLYRDSKVRSVFYYVPYGLELVKDKDSKPDFKFIQMRYTGTQLSKDQGINRFKSLLRFRVANRVPSAAKRDNIKENLREKGIHISKLDPLPIHNLKATLIYSTINDSITKVYTDGFFEGGKTNEANAYWTERDFILRLSNEDAQLFQATLQSNQPMLSINYSYLAKGLNETINEMIVSGSQKLKEEMKSYQQKYSPANTPIEKVVVSGALPIAISLKKWPDLIKQIDINERIPPEYAALDVYCYDFNNEIRSDLYAKIIEIKATGVSGKEIHFRTTFRAWEPEIYAHTIKFTYAINLEKPYTYRITEISNNGRQRRSGWKTARSWHQIIDITGQIEKKIKRSH
ncbi:MAG: hypothetical protein AAF934_05525 [Bacteroidota bacterium]